MTRREEAEVHVEMARIALSFAEEAPESVAAVHRRHAERQLELARDKLKPRKGQ